MLNSQQSITVTNALKLKILIEDLTKWARNNCLYIAANETVENTKNLTKIPCSLFKQACLNNTFNILRELSTLISVDFKMFEDEKKCKNICPSMNTKTILQILISLTPCGVNNRLPSENLVNKLVEQISIDASKSYLHISKTNRPSLTKVDISDNTPKIHFPLFPSCDEDGNDARKDTLPIYFYDHPIPLLPFHTPDEECVLFKRYTECAFVSFSLMLKT
jgi:hypothetical protein